MQDQGVHKENGSGAYRTIVKEFCNGFKCKDWIVVCKGDNLADIAKKFYGPKEGNRRANIKRIFEANHKALESPDKICPGQKLIIPPLWASAPDKNSIESIFPDSMFEKVESIGRRHL